MTVEEQMRGWLGAIRRAAAGPPLTMAYARLKAALEYFQTVKVLDFTDQADEHFRRLRQQRIRVGAQDLRIAAIALTTGRTLVTRNASDFQQVPGLTIEDWTSGFSG